ncbi:MAG: hypothetical protein IH988_02710 [Planctomycetes bacterium]|nr:hypothetical protein [Planctomycetota bacterium]
MTTFPGSPRLLKGGIVLIDPESSAVLRIIAMQYNPKTLSRSLQIKSVGEEGDRSQPLRLSGPPVETINLEAKIDAADQLEFPESNAATVEFGIFPQLAALESLVYPSSTQLQSNNALAQSGTLEIVPMETPLPLFIWSKNRILPVRLTEFSVTEEAFDPALNPLRATVTLGMRVLTVDDLGFSHKGGGLFMSYLQAKERLASLSKGGELGVLGLGGIP